MNKILKKLELWSFFFHFDHKFLNIDQFFSQRLIVVSFCRMGIKRGVAFQEFGQRSWREFQTNDVISDDSPWIILVPHLKFENDWMQSRFSTSISSFQEELNFLAVASRLASVTVLS